MAFLGGGDASCSTGSNPLSQFSKHLQDDKTLQRDRLIGRGPGGLQEGFRNGVGREGPRAAEGMMDEFMQQPNHMPPPGVAPVAMEQMRREFEKLHAGGPPQQANASPHNWAGEFDPGMNQGPGFASQRPGGFDHAEFERFVQMKQQQEGRSGSPRTMNGFQRPMGGMGMGYTPMYMGGMGMMGQPIGSTMGSVYGEPPQQPVEGKGKGRMVELDEHDWEAQFAQLEQGDKTAPGETDTLDEEANRAMENELEELDRELANASTDDLSQVDWDNFDSLGLGTHGDLRDPELGNYMFEQDNIFDSLMNPYEEGVRIMDESGNLSLAALAFEAAVQKDPQHIDAWTRLGAAQAQNEKETPAIRALEQALRLDPNNLTALMGLAVSYTNEGYESTAYRTLQRWLAAKYPDVIPPEETAAALDPLHSEIGFTERAELHRRVTDQFIAAAQKAPSPEAMDPDVQVGLGVLFYGAEQYDKAVDCFSAALASNERGTSNAATMNQRPLLWNRLGATLANSGRSEEAISAYEAALQLNPNFVRARYNLGVSCINIGCYTEAAQHLLGALDMHKMVEREGREKAREIVESGGGGGGIGPSPDGGPMGIGADGTLGDADIQRLMRHNQSTNLYDTLRRVFGQMGRPDLADRVVPGVDPGTFRGEFEF